MCGPGANAVIEVAIPAASILAHIAQIAFPSIMLRGSISGSALGSMLGVSFLGIMLG